MTTLTRGDLLHLHAGYPRKSAEELHAAAGIQRKAAPDPSEQYLQQLADANVPGIAAIIAQHRTGALSLSQAVTQARQAASEWYGQQVDDVTPGQRSTQHVLAAGIVFGALGALTHLGGGGQSAALPTAVATVSLNAAAAETGTTATRTDRQEAAQEISERLSAIWESADAGTISDAQAAAQEATAIDNAIWTTYQNRRKDEAQSAGKATATYVLDPGVKEHCGDCQDRADGSPWPIAEMPGIPGDGSTECGPGDQCDVTYEDAEAEGGEEEGD